MFRLFTITFAAACIAVAPGCGSSEPEYTERIRVDEVLSKRDVGRFLRIVESLPEGRLEVMQPVFAPLPNWDRTRTLPVSELLRLERESIEARWNVDWLVKRAKPTRRLERALARESMTHGQFVAMALSIGAALRRSTLRPEQELADVIATGGSRWRELEADLRPFASLPPDVQYRMLQQAAWLVRVHRAQRLDDVPPENLAIVDEFRERLAPVFPLEFLENPFDPILDPLEEFGVPFLERAGNDDGRIEWTPAGAIVGNDLPDPEFRTGPTDDSPEPERIILRETPTAARTDASIGTE